MTRPSRRRWGVGPRAVAVGLVSLLAPVGAIALRVNITGEGTETVAMAGHGQKQRAAGSAGAETTDKAGMAGMEAMTGMEPVDGARIRFRAGAGDRGSRPVDGDFDNGAKIFDLVASLIEWRILPDVPVAAYAFNRQVPGPLLRARQGDRLRVNVVNALPEPTSVHWHGLILPNEMDGAAGVTQDPIAPGETFTYDFTVEQAGTYFYHSHYQADRQQALGLYGALVVDPAEPPATAEADQDVVVMLQEWLQRDGKTYPAMTAEGLLPNYFTINGKAYPDTETVRLRVGERLRLRLIGSNTSSSHPMHIHGGPFRIVETDGNPVPEAAQLTKDTVNVAPGERYDVIWEARRPGKWLLHCHIPHHTTNDHQETEGAGGLSMLIEVSS